jgi:hypothetical protein
MPRSSPHTGKSSARHVLVNDGVEVETQGDAFFVAFATAPAALAAAPELTDTLVRPVQVRVGLHTGTPLLSDGGYVGVDGSPSVTDRLPVASPGLPPPVAGAAEDQVGLRLPDPDVRSRPHRR